MRTGDEMATKFEIRAAPRARSDFLIALFLVIGAAVLRTTHLGFPFHSSDHAELAVRILRCPGYAWMSRELYGFLISFYVKLCASFVSALGIGLTEFWWRLPIAAVGSLQPALTYFFLRWLGCRRIGATAGAAFIAVLPIHVCNSRYLWGYETLGIFCITGALWALIAFLKRPCPKLAVSASLALTLYLISHGYILPFAVCFLCLVAAFGGPGDRNVLKNFSIGMEQIVRRLIWLGPLFASPLLVSPILHALRKKTHLGLYVDDHFADFVGNMGWVLCAVILATVVVGILLKAIRTRATVFFAISGAAYFAPLVFGTPPGITLAGSYLLMGTYLWILCAAVVLDRLAARFRFPVMCAVVLCTVVTAWGAKDAAIFPEQNMVGTLLRVRSAPGATPRDCGAKAAGYYVRKHVPTTSRVLALARVLEPPNLFYYFGRNKFAFYDLTTEASIRKFEEMGNSVDVVICREAQRLAVEADGQFILRATVSNQRRPCMWIYSRENTPLPEKNLRTEKINRLFDLEFAPRVSILPE